jgi:uncharacterized membrane protein YdjX (TVP38/TMEM64 family)
VADEPIFERNGKGRFRRWLRFLPLAVVLAGVAVGYGMGWHERLSLQRLAEGREALKHFVADNALMAPMAYMALHASAVALFFPAAALLTAIGGFLFGWLAGALYAIIAAMAGGTVLFLAARTAFGDLFRKRADTSLGKLAHEFQQDAFTWVFILRLAPFIPFAMASIAPALFNVRLRTFMAATLIGILPGAFAYAWLGHGLDSVFMAATAAKRQLTLADLATPEITIALLVLTLVAVLATIVRKVRGTRMS